MQMGIRNMLDVFNQYAANEFKRQQGNYMLDLYRQRGALDRERLNWEKSSGVGKNTLFYMPTIPAMTSLVPGPQAPVIPNAPIKIR